MFNRDGASRIRRGKLAGIAVMALAVPFTVTSGLSKDTGTIELPKEAAIPAPHENDRYPTGAYQLRCWQEGRLLFEEHYVTLPPDAVKSSVKLATDRSGKPIFVSEMKSAICLIRRPNDERSNPRETP